MFDGIGPNDFLFSVGALDLSKNRFNFNVEKVWIVMGPTMFGYWFVVCFKMPLGAVRSFGIDGILEEECVVVFLPNVRSKADWEEGFFFWSIYLFEDW